MANKLMYIPNDPVVVVETKLNTQLNELTNYNSLESPKLSNQRVIKRYYKTLGTSVVTAHCPLSLAISVTSYSYC